MWDLDPDRCSPRNVTGGRTAEHTRPLRRRDSDGAEITAELYRRIIVQERAKSKGGPLTLGAMRKDTPQRERKGRQLRRPSKAISIMGFVWIKQR